MEARFPCNVHRHNHTSLFIFDKRKQLINFETNTLYENSTLGVHGNLSWFYSLDKHFPKIPHEAILFRTNWLLYHRLHLWAAVCDEAKIKAINFLNCSRFWVGERWAQKKNLFEYEWIRKQTKSLYSPRFLYSTTCGIYLAIDKFVFRDLQRIYDTIPPLLHRKDNFPVDSKSLPLQHKLSYPNYGMICKVWQSCPWISTIRHWFVQLQVHCHHHCRHRLAPKLRCSNYRKSRTVNSRRTRQISYMYS